MFVASIATFGALVFCAFYVKLISVQALSNILEDLQIVSTKELETLIEKNNIYADITLIQLAEFGNLVYAVLKAIEKKSNKSITIAQNQDDDFSETEIQTTQSFQLNKKSLIQCL